MMNRNTILLSGSLVLILILIVGCQKTLSGEASASGSQASKTQTVIQQLSDEELAFMKVSIEKGKDLGASSSKIVTLGKTLNRIPAEQKLALVNAEIAKRISRPTRCVSTRDCPFMYSQVCGIDESGARVCEPLNQPTGSRCESAAECGERLVSCIRSDDNAMRTCHDCTETPSCNGPNYVLSTVPCRDEVFGYAESCYVCSVQEDLRERAECPEGWQYGDYLDTGVTWHLGGFSCHSECANDCLRGNSATQEECLSACSPQSSLENLCPVGFTYSALSDPFAYKCLMPSGPITDDDVCNQCGSGGAGQMGNGDLVCTIR